MSPDEYGAYLAEYLRLAGNEDAADAQEPERAMTGEQWRWLNGATHEDE